jgi:small-conductance mechanosensitive channel
MILVCAMALSIPLARNMSAAFISFIFGVTTVVVGIAAKPFIENIIGGLVISFAQPIRIGDTVLMDQKMYGTVEDISLTFTVVKLWDWRRFVVPNHRMLEKEFINLSLVDRYTWSYVEFWVSHDADLVEVKALAIMAAKEAPHFASHESPAFWVMELGERGVKCWVAAWANTPSQAWELKHEIRTALAQALRRRGIQCHAYHHEVVTRPPVDGLAPSPPFDESPMAVAEWLSHRPEGVEKS